jgi:uncharacterized coiled-coil protein SlyX
MILEAKQRLAAAATVGAFINKSLTELKDQIAEQERAINNTKGFIKTCEKFAHFLDSKLKLQFKELGVASCDLALLSTVSLDETVAAVSEGLKLKLKEVAKRKFEASSEYQGIGYTIKISEQSKKALVEIEFEDLKKD